MLPNLIPAPDAIPMPGPAWLFQLLLVFTFFLHLIFVNLALGGSLLAAVAQIASGGRAGDARAALASRLATINGYGISLAITTGVAPLLFIQVLYGQYFYTATILLGWIWFGLLVVLMIGYYALYLYKFRSVPEGGAATGWLVLSALMFLAVAVVQVMVNLLHSQPGRWPDAVHDPWIILSDPTFLPRLLHFVLAAVGFSALVVCWWAVRQARRDGSSPLEAPMASYAWKWVLWTALIQIADGLVLFFLLPGRVIAGLMKAGASAHVPLTLGILLGLVLLVLLARTRDPLAPGRVTAVLFLYLGSMAFMTVTRHQIRGLYLQASTSRFHLAATPEWGIFTLFAVLLVAGLATVAWMIHRVLSSPATGDDAA